MEDNRINNGKNQERNSLGQFAEGNSAAKKKGQKYKTRQFTLRQRQLLQKVLDNHMKDFDRLLLTVPVKERYDLIAKFSKFVIPALSSVDMNAHVETEGKMNIIVSYEDTETDEPKED